MRGKIKISKKKSTPAKKIVSKKASATRASLFKKLLGIRSKAKKPALGKTFSIGKKTSKRSLSRKKPGFRPKIRAGKLKLGAKIKTTAGKARIKKEKTSFLEDKQLSGYLETLVGPDGMKVVQQIAQKERSDVDLAEKMDLKANIIRKHLYSMYEAGVVTYKRHRSKTGWYTYFWKLHPERIIRAINHDKDNQIKELMEMLEYEKNNHFYQCKNRCTRVIFDEATDLAFKCMKCNESLEHADNKEFISDIETKINRLRAGKESQ